MERSDGRACARPATSANLYSRSQSEESRDDRGRGTLLTLSDVATRLKVNEDTVRRLFINEPGVVIICFPRKGKRVYRTLRIPENCFNAC